MMGVWGHAANTQLQLELETEGISSASKGAGD